MLMGGGLPSVKFANLGDKTEGLIVRVGEPRQQTDFSSGELKTWPDGNPVMVIPVELKTEAREGPDDDGGRTLWIQLGSELHGKTRDAIRKSGGSGLEVGGWISVVHDKTEPSKIRGGYPKKLHTVVYVPAPEAPVEAPADEMAQAVKQFDQSMAQTTPRPLPATDPGQVAAAIAALTPDQRVQLGLPPY
jgi:hypothetical protein